MASRRRTQTTGYQTYGSVAYAPAYQGGAVRAPRRGEEGYQSPPQPKVREKTRTKTLTRTQVQVRQAGKVSPFAVIGFLAVGVFAALLLLSYVQYAMLTDQMVGLRSQVSVLQAENASLTAQYERVFDMERIQAAVGDTMIRPTAAQVVYIDLSEPDSVILYNGQTGVNGVQGFVVSAKEILDDLLEYFR